MNDLFHNSDRPKHFHWAPHFVKHAEDAVYWSTPNTPFYETRKARKYTKFVEHVSK